jgi:hypothetical protein
MAIFPGTIAASGQAAAANPHLSADLDEFALENWPPHATTISVLGVDGYADARPVEVVSGAVSGSVAASFLQDWYYRVHIVPAVLDLGQLVSAQTRSVEVWNAFFEEHALGSIAGQNTDGITLAGPIPPPTAFGALESRLYTVVVDLAGPPTVDALYTFDFAFVDAALRILGVRVIGWPFAPDWSEPVLERLEWATDVIESWSGKEQRVRLRAHPRRGLEYRFLAGDDFARVTLEHLLLFWQARAYALPIWMDVERLRLAVAAGTTQIPVQTAGREFEVGGLVALIDGLDTEFGEIETIAPDGLTVKTPLARDFPPGTKVAPARAARMEDALDLVYHTDTVVEARVRFRFEQGWAGAAAAEPDTYRGYPVLIDRTDWSEGLEARHARKLVELDYMTGRRIADDASGVSRVRRSHAWLLHGREAIGAFRAWASARAGRLNPVWLPSQQADFVVVAPIGASSASITVGARRYAATIGPGVGRRDLMILLKDGGRFYRRVIGATDLGDGTEILALDAPLGFAVSPEDVARVSFMVLARCEADAVELAHLTDALAAARLAFVSVRDDA